MLVTEGCAANHACAVADGCSGHSNAAERMTNDNEV